MKVIRRVTIAIMASWDRVAMTESLVSVDFNRALMLHELDMKAHLILPSIQTSELLSLHGITDSEVF